MAKDAVMISIRPEWCKLIAEGKKTVEVRKNFPLSANIPFKCYIYESRDRKAVIGEFVCDCIRVIKEPYWDKVAGTCLTARQMHKYAQGTLLYGWHISDLVIYDQPKALDEFVPVCKYQNDDGTCQYKKVSCDCAGFDYNHDGSLNLVECLNFMKRPPQSWCYVYGLKEDVE